MLNDRCLSRTEDAIIFGLNFENYNRDGGKTYGVICEVYEKGVDHHGHITVKSKAVQRYQVIERDGKDKEVRNGAYHSTVKILPEILLNEPYFLGISNGLRKHAHNSSDKFKSFVAASSRWPKFVYDLYSVKPVSEKIERYLAMLGIESPSDPILKTWWLARNVPLNPNDRLKIFKTNCVNKRLQMIGESLNFVAHFLCKRCRNKIAVYNDIFAISKGNVNSQFCNPAGYIHETLTVNKVFDSSLRMVDRPSAEFSWFPGN
jgi:cereblon